MNTNTDRDVRQATLEKKIARLRILTILNSPAVFWPFMAAVVVGSIFLGRFIVVALGHKPISWHEELEHSWPFLVLYGSRSAWRWWKAHRRNPHQSAV